MKEEESSVRKDLGSALFGGSAGLGSAMVRGGNPFSTSDSNATRPNPFSTALAHANDTSLSSTKEETNLSISFAAKATISSTDSNPFSGQIQPTQNDHHEPRIPWPTDPSTLPKPYPTSYLDAEYDHIFPLSNMSNISNTSPNFENDDPTSLDPSGPNDKARKPNQKASAKDTKIDDAAAKALERSGHDATFLHFADITSQNPEQVLRYYDITASTPTMPLLYSRSDEVGRILSPSAHEGVAAGAIEVGDVSERLPRCGNCGGKRVVEVQLMPHAITTLERDMEPAQAFEEGMEWGSLVVGVCDKDCGADPDATEGYVEEWVGVSWEEVVMWSPAGDGKGQTQTAASGGSGGLTDGKKKGKKK